jgi:uncharacterized membrane protein
MKGSVVFKVFHCKSHVLLDSGSDTSKNTMITALTNLFILTIVKVGYRITEAGKTTIIPEEQFKKLVFIIVNVQTEIVFLILGQLLLVHVKRVASEVLEDVVHLVAVKVFGDVADVRVLV